MEKQSSGYLGCGSAGFVRGSVSVLLAKSCLSSAILWVASIFGQNHAACSQLLCARNHCRCHATLRPAHIAENTTWTLADRSLAHFVL